MPTAPDLSLDEVGDFLAHRYGSTVGGLAALSGGFWSSAYGYEIDGHELVIRFGSIRSGFEADRKAMEFDRPGLPVPAVLEIGDAFGGAYAVSVRRCGRFLEEVAAEESVVAGPMILNLLASLYGIQTEVDASVDWLSAGAGSALTWRQWLIDGLVDSPTRPNYGWSSTLAANDEFDGLFWRCRERIEGLLEACPERRDMVHGDLLHGNVLVSENADQVNAVISWKCSVLGDFLFDAAWCAFWGRVAHPGIAAADVFGRVLAAPWAAADPTALADAAHRRHCYELHIGATHLGWSAWVGDEAALSSIGGALSLILDQGPT
jgi:hypothetical protein